MQREDPSGPLSPKANSTEGQQDLPMLASRMPSSLGVRSYDRKGSRKTKAQGSWQRKSSSELNPSCKHCAALWEVIGFVLLPVWCNKTSSLSATSWSQLSKQHMCRGWHSFCMKGDIGTSQANPLSSESWDRERNQMCSVLWTSALPEGTQWFTTRAWVDCPG